MPFHNRSINLPNRKPLNGGNTDYVPYRKSGLLFMISINQSIISVQEAASYVLPEEVSLKEVRMRPGI